jgi:hypothetical protein
MALVIDLAEAHTQADIMDVMLIVSAGMGATAPYIARAPDFALLTSGISVPIDEARQFGECAASGGMIMPHPNHPDPR